MRREEIYRSLTHLLAVTQSNPFIYLFPLCPISNLEEDTWISASQLQWMTREEFIYTVIALTYLKVELEPHGPIYLEREREVKVMVGQKLD